MVKVKKQALVEILDPVWQDIRDGAQTIADNEPCLSSFVISSVLNHASFEEALSHRISQRLHHIDLSSDLIRQAFDEVMQISPEIGEAARADIVATMDRDPACHRALEPFLYFKGFQAIQTHRFAFALYKHGRKDLAYYLQSRSSSVFQVDINPKVLIGKGIMLDHGTGVVVGETAKIGDNVSILQGVTLGGTGKEDGNRHPKVGTGVLIGAGAKILGNITIGNCARIAAGSVVLKDVPSCKTVAGVPAKIIGEAGCSHPASEMNQMFNRKE